MIDATIPVEWLLAEGPPWVQAWTLRDLVGRPVDDPDLIAAQRATGDHPLVQQLFADVATWPGPALKRHNDAAHPLHKLAALADFGLTLDHPVLESVVARVLAAQSPEGAFTVAMQVQERFGGDGQLHTAWMLCDAPVTLYALLALGIQPDHPAIQRAVEHLTDLIRDNGWPCAAAESYTGFRGPGRKEDFCPYATLVALKALSLIPALHDSAAVKTGIEALLWHWEHQAERKLYLFGIGTDFRKPKYPLIWYDVLHVVDVLSRFPAARANSFFQTMLDELLGQADDMGRIRAQSMYRAWQGWDFADKKSPSPTITAAAWRVWQRAQH
ncbi:MAG: hypothetical protein JXN59_19000 [Anaerolineae bacterium]|nr:hypothetical protein [Anaerolineae bacterium]